MSHNSILYEPWLWSGAIDDLLKGHLFMASVKKDDER